MGKVHVLREDEEWQLLKEHNDEEARGRLAEHYLPLVKNIVDRIAYRLPDFVDREDLINEGIVGLIDAIDKFEPDRALKFETYAVVRVRGAVLDSLRHMDWLPRSLRQRSREIERAFSEVERQLGRAASDQEVADFLHISAKELNDTLSDISSSVVFSFEELLQMSDEDKPLTFISRIKDQTAEDPSSRLVRGEVRRILLEAVATLPDTERTVVGLYYVENLTLKEIGAVLNVSESRVSQLHTRALLRLKGALIRADEGFNEE